VGSELHFEYFNYNVNLFKVTNIFFCHIGCSALWPYQTVKKGDLWYCAMSYIANHGPNGAGAFGFGAITDTVHKPHIVVAKKSWVGDYVEFEIRLK
jgi:hypothetical protein